jgi:ABC-type anion transport system duplicated permease subunit
MELNQPIVTDYGFLIPLVFIIAFIYIIYDLKTGWNKIIERDNDVNKNKKQGS